MRALFTLWEEDGSTCRNSVRRATLLENGNPETERQAQVGDGLKTKTCPGKDITRYARITRKMVLEAWPEIIDALVARARNGRYQEIKLLIELCDLGNVDPDQSNNERQRHLCDALLDGLGLTFEPRENPGAEAANLPHSD